MIDAHDFLRPLAGNYDHALVLFDHDGCGRPDLLPQPLAEGCRSRLAGSGWSSRAEGIALGAELEVWVWSPSPHVDECLGRANRQPSLRAWPETEGHWPAASPKPPSPKQAMEAALREVHKPRSSSIYGQLAEQVSLVGHTEPAFVHLTGTLRRWFPAPDRGDILPVGAASP